MYKNKKNLKVNSGIKEIKIYEKNKETKLQKAFHQ